MFNLIQADLFKLRKTMAIKVLFLIATLSSLIMALIAYSIAKGSFDGMNGIGFMFSDINVISILGGVMAGIFISGDFENKIIHGSISSGNNRGAVIISKAVTFFCSIIVILIPYVVVTIVALNIGNKFNMGNVALGFLNVMTIDYGTVFSATEVLKLLGVIITLIIVYVAQLSICVPIALTTKKPVLVVGIYYGVTILVAQLSALGESNSVLKNILSVMPYGGNYTLINLNTGTEDIVKAVIVSLVFIVLMLGVTYSLFRKAEIK
ncbi:ABC transporter permease [Clostridium intestinale]|uniref:ABC-2 family transporter protein n=1 Tax=Clostridium intestinale DSM 6191 TaxID=1121320 RepID=A0A1M5W8P4_9CLOT|nr:ABC transporter permease [Clostridium intestinale]SHH83835.1 ABC-2 family transporter protein [Clostridium intestinale DSM 6191]